MVGGSLQRRMGRCDSTRLLFRWGRSAAFLRMKAMVLRAPSQLALDEVARPEVPPGHVLVRITNSGLCGTDLKIYKGAIPAKYPLIMGHEMIGELVGGEPPDGIRKGDRVII